MLRRTLALIGLFVALTGCASGGAPSQAPDDGAVVDATGAWQLASGVIDGVGFAIVADAPITLSVKGSEVGGRSACNHYGAEMVMEDGQLRMRVTSMTQMACPEPAMAAEAAFTVALGRITGAARDGDRLVLTGPGVELTFDRLPPVPVADMVGTDWVLESLISGEAPPAWPVRRRRCGSGRTARSSVRPDAGRSRVDGSRPSAGSPRLTSPWTASARPSSRRRMDMSSA